MPTPDPDRQILEYLDIVKQMPPLNPRRILLPTEANPLLMTCACDIPKRIKDMPRKSSGIFGFTDTVCYGCRRWAKTATLVCATCKAVVGKIEPGEDPKDHFKIETGKVYHVMQCNVCTPAAASSDLIERILWRRNLGIPNPVVVAR